MSNYFPRVWQPGCQTRASKPIHNLIVDNHMRDDHGLARFAGGELRLGIEVVDFDPEHIGDAREQDGVDDAGVDRIFGERDGFALNVVDAKGDGHRPRIRLDLAAADVEIAGALQRIRAQLQAAFDQVSLMFTSSAQTARPAAFGQTGIEHLWGKFDTYIIARSGNYWNALAKNFKTFPIGKYNLR